MSGICELEKQQLLASLAFCIQMRPWTNVEFTCGRSVAEVPEELIEVQDQPFLFPIALHLGGWLRNSHSLLRSLLDLGGWLCPQTQY